MSNKLSGIMPIAGTTADWAENPDLFGEKRSRTRKTK